MNNLPNNVRNLLTLEAEKSLDNFKRQIFDTGFPPEFSEQFVKRIEPNKRITKINNWIAKELEIVDDLQSLINEHTKNKEAFNSIKQTQLKRRRDLRNAKSYLSAIPQYLSVIAENSNGRVDSYVNCYLTATYPDTKYNTCNHKTMVKLRATITFFIEPLHIKLLTVGDTYYDTRELLDKLLSNYEDRWGDVPSQ